MNHASCTTSAAACPHAGIFRTLLLAPLIALLVLGSANQSPAASGQIDPGTAGSYDWPTNSTAKDPSGNVYGFWRKNSGTSAVYSLIRWNGASWVTVGSFTPANAGFLRAYDSVGLAIDATGAFHVVVTGDFGANPISSTRGIWYATSANGTTWTFTQVETYSDPNGWKNVYSPVIRVDSANHPHIAFDFDDVNGTRTYKVRYRWFDGAVWQGSGAAGDVYVQAGVASNEVNYPSFALDSANKAHFALQAETNGSGLDGSLFYVNNVSGSYSAPVTLHSGITGGATGFGSDVVVDGANKVHVTFSDSGQGIYHSTNASGAFVTQQINGNLLGSTSAQCLSRNSDGSILLVFRGESTPRPLRYAVLPGGTGNAWSVGTLFTSGASAEAINYYSAVLTNAGMAFALFDNAPTGPPPRGLWYANGQVTVGGATAPIVSAPTSASVTPSSATLGGTVNGTGNSAITARGVVYSKTSDDATPTLGEPLVTNATTGGTTGTFTVNVSSLTPNTQYSFAAYATNGVGTSYTTVTTIFTGGTGPVLSQIGGLGSSAALNDNTLENYTLAAGTDRVLIVFASHASELDITGVTFSGLPLTQIVERNDGFAVDSIWARAMGTSASPTIGNIAVTRAGSASSMQVIFAVAYQNADQATPLNAPQAANANSGNSFLNIVSEPGDIVIDLFDNYNDTLRPTSNVGSGQTVLHSAVGGSLAPATGFGNYITSTEPGTGSVEMRWTSNGTAMIQVAANINKTTVIATAPAISSPTSIVGGATTATLGGNVTGDGNAPITTRGVVYARTVDDSSPTLGEANVLSATTGGTTGIFTVNVSSLQPGTQYSFAAFATNAVGTSYTSPVSTFTTPAVAPTVTSASFSNVASTSATLGGNVTSNGGSSITERGVVYARTADDSTPTLGEANVFSATTSAAVGAFTVDVTGLLPLTQYSFAAYAKNSVGTTYTSPFSTFTTAGTPEIAVSETGIGNIADGGSFSFGTAVVGQTVTKTFTITNSGTATLNLSSLTLPPGFSIAANFGSATVAPSGGTTTFQITMNATGPATPSGTLSFTNDDSDENPFNFTISGTVNKADTTVTNLTDAPDPSAVGQTVNVGCSVVVTAPGSGTLTGTVTASDGVDSNTVPVVSGGTTTIPLALTTPGVRTITVSYSGDANFNASSNTAGHLVNPPPTVTSIAPASGTTSGGTPVVITGTNFTGATGVTFGGTPAASFSVVNATTINALTPPGAAGPANVVVTTPGGSNAVPAVFTYVAPGTLRFYSLTLDGPSESPPNASPATGTGTLVIDTVAQTMTYNVTFSGLTGTTTAAHVHAATSAPRAGTVGVATTLPNFTGFPLGVTGGSFTRTDNMTLAGSYNPTFITNNGGTPASAFAALIAAVDGGKAYFNIHSTTLPGGEIRGFFNASSAATPNVASISPTSGPIAGGTSVTITGTGFIGATGATVGGVALTSVFVSATTISGITGAHAAGPVDVAVTGAPGGASTGGTGIFTYFTPPFPSIIDDGDAGFATTGAWAANAAGHQGDSVTHAAGTGTNFVEWTFTGLAPGFYQVSATWPADAGLNTSAASFRTTSVDGSRTDVVDQRIAPNDFTDAGSSWERLGLPVRVAALGGTLTVRLSDNAPSGRVVADAVRIQWLGNAEIALLDPTGGGVLLNSGESVFNIGAILLSGPAQQRTIEVRNHGAQSLSVGALTLPNGYTLVSAPASSVPAATGAGYGATSFTFQLNSFPPGPFIGTLSLVNGDADESPYTITVRGNVVAQLPGSTIADDGDAGYSDTGLSTSPTPGYSGDQRAMPTGTPATATWSFTGLSPNNVYRVSATWVPVSGAATAAPFATYDGSVAPANLLGSVLVDQSVAPNDFFVDGADWEDLGGAYRVGPSGTLVVQLTTPASGTALADAVRVEQMFGPEIQVLDAATNVPHNTGVVALGTVAVGTPIVRTFTVKNLGTAALTLGTPTLPAGYQLTSAPAASVANGSSTTFQITLPGSSPVGTYTGQITFSNNDTDEAPFRFTVQAMVGAAPTVTSIAPLSGPVAGGTSVVINGTNFTGATAVTFGGTPAAGFTVVNATTINATTPPGAAGPASVVVTTPGGSNAVPLFFTYVAPANAAPTDITLSNASINENNAPGATIGTLGAVDPNGGQTHTFALVAGVGGDDNAAFTITGNTLSINASADFETKNSYSVRVQTTDNGVPPQSFEKAFTISILDVNETPGVPVLLVASSGTVPVGAPAGAQFHSLKPGPKINTPGRTAFRAWLIVGTGGVTSASDTGIWAYDSLGALQLLGLESGPAAGVADTYGSFDINPAWNDTGSYAFSADLLVNHSGIWEGSMSGGAPLPILVGNGPVPGLSGGEVVGNVSTPVVRNESGRLALRLFLKAGVGGVATTDDGAIVNGPSSALQIIAREGSAAPGTDGKFANLFFPDWVQQDAAGRVTYIGVLASQTRPTAITANNNMGVWLWDSGVTTLVARGGDAAAGLPAGVLYYQPRWSLVWNGKVTFRSSLRGAVVAGVDYAAIFAGTPGGSLGAIARLGVISGAGIPAGVAGAAYSKLGNPRLARSAGAETAFRGELKVGVGPVASTAENEGIWKESGGVVSLLVREGMSVPGLSGVSFGALGEPFLGENGRVCFTAKLTGAGVLTNADSAWFAEDSSGNIRLLLREGQVLATVGGPRTVNDVQSLNANPEDERIMNSAGTFVTHVPFLYSHTALVTIAVP